MQDTIDSHVLEQHRFNPPVPPVTAALTTTRKESQMRPLAQQVILGISVSWFLVVGLASPALADPDAPASTPTSANHRPLRVAMATTAQTTATTNSSAVLRDGAPQQYVVQRGDTLWDIATRLLNDPWRWRELWEANTYIRNPDLIYPGDIITITDQDGRTRIQVRRGDVDQTVATAGLTRAERDESAASVGVSSGTVKLSPRIRTEPLPETRKHIPVQTIRQFLVRPRLIEPSEFRAAPYIVDSQDERLVYGTGDQVYVRGMTDAPGFADLARFEIYREGDELIDPESGERLGQQAIFIGEAKLVRRGTPTTVLLTDTVREVLRGDRLLPGQGEQPIYTFTPTAPPPGSAGLVIDLFDAISQIGKYEVAVLNRGNRDGIDAGTVFAVYRSGRIVRDRIGQRGEAKLALPDERTGLMMVFRSFDKLSYALVMESQRPIHVGDAVKAP